MWTFFQLDRLIKHDLYFRHRTRQAQAAQRAATSAVQNDTAAAGDTQAREQPPPSTAAPAQASGDGASSSTGVPDAPPAWSQAL